MNDTDRDKRNIGRFITADARGIISEEVMSVAEARERLREHMNTGADLEADDASYLENGSHAA
jgi:hypothetical protein